MEFRTKEFWRNITEFMDFHLKSGFCNISPECFCRNNGHSRCYSQAASCIFNNQENKKEFHQSRKLSIRIIDLFRINLCFRKDGNEIIEVI